MSDETSPIPPWHVLDTEQVTRWRHVLDTLTTLLPAGPATVVVDGADGYPAAFADRLGGFLGDRGRPCARPAPGTLTVAGAVLSPAGPDSLTIWLRTPAGPRRGQPDADVAIDLHDPAWPVIRHIDPRRADHDGWFLAESRAFFATRAATWDTKFGDDTAAYAAAIADADIPAGATVLDLGCGTGRALPGLRAAVGPAGTVLGADSTDQMLAAAVTHGRARHATLLLADARHLPLAAGSVDTVFAAGVVHHLPDPGAGLAEIARITRTGGQLVLFHPSGRAALAARHGHALRPDEPMAETPLRTTLAATGWHLTTYDDPPHRLFARAVRR